eukprot:1148322-Prorocentrum_minimum.AAC.1
MLVRTFVRVRGNLRRFAVALTRNRSGLATLALTVGRRMGAAAADGPDRAAHGLRQDPLRQQGASYGGACAGPFVQPPKRPLTNRVAVERKEATKRGETNANRKTEKHGWATDVCLAWLTVSGPRDWNAARFSQLTLAESELTLAESELTLKPKSLRAGVSLAPLRRSLACAPACEYNGSIHGEGVNSLWEGIDSLREGVDSLREGVKSLRGSIRCNVLTLEGVDHPARRQDPDENLSELASKFVSQTFKSLKAKSMKGVEVGGSGRGRSSSASSKQGSYKQPIDPTRRPSVGSEVSLPSGTEVTEGDLSPQESFARRLSSLPELGSTPSASAGKIPQAYTGFLGFVHTLDSMWSVFLRRVEELEKVYILVERILAVRGTGGPVCPPGEPLVTVIDVIKDLESAFGIDLGAKRRQLQGLEEDINKRYEALQGLIASVRCASRGPRGGPEG